MSAPLKQNSLPLSVGFMTRQLGCHPHDITGLKADAFDTPQSRIIGIWHTKHHRTIVPLNLMGFKLCRQRVMRAIGFGHYQQATSLFVDTVYDPRALLASYPR